MTASRGLAILIALLPVQATAQDLVVRGEIVYTMAGEAIPNGVVVIQDGKITAVGAAGSVPVPALVEVRTAAVVTPGLIDAHATVGLTGIYNQSQDQDQLEESEPIQPELRAIDAYNARDPLVAWVRSFGITTVHTGHAPGAVISGQTLIAKTVGDTIDEAVFVRAAMIAATLGNGARADDGAPGTRSKAVAMLRQELIEAREYQAEHDAADDDDPPSRDLRHEALARCLAGELPLLVTAHKHHDILAALRIGQEFGLSIVLDGAADAPLVLEQIAAAGVPVIVHPAMLRSGGAASETASVSFETAALLARAGIPFAQQSGFEGYVPKVRVALLEAAIAGRYGLEFNANLASITSGAAAILGIADRVGSLEVGKHGDVALFDGDPFEYTSHCVGVIIEGVVVSDATR